MHLEIDYLISMHRASRLTKLAVNKVSKVNKVCKDNKITIYCKMHAVCKLGDSAADYADHKFIDSNYIMWSTIATT